MRRSSKILVFAKILQRRSATTVCKNRIRFYSQIPEKTKTLSKFTFQSSTHSIQKINQEIDKLVGDVSRKVVINGNINKKPRIMTNRSFAELRDENGDIIQIVMTPDSTDVKYFEMLKAGFPEDCVSVSGHIQTKQPKSGQTLRELELVVENYQLLNSSNLDAARLDKLKHASPSDLPPQFRYLQLRTKYLQNALKIRSKVSNLVRNIFIERHGFTEIETPLLFKSTPEGAREFLVPTRTPNKFYALPQSPQQYKQLLMSSGFTRYFQIAKCFRDEDLRADRQPEFTQIDLEMAFINTSNQVMAVVEDIIHNIWNEIKRLPTYKVNENDYLEKIDHKSSEVSFSKINYVDALCKYGIDKPDLRSSLQFIDLSEHFVSTKNSEFPILELCILKNAFDPSHKYSIPKSLIDANNYSRRKPVVLMMKTNNDCSSWYNKFVDKGFMKKTTGFDECKLKEKLNLSAGDIIAFSTRAKLPYENPTPLGKFRQLAIQEFPNKWNRKIIDRNTGELIEEYDRNNIFVGSWIVDFPLFNPIEISESINDEFPKYDYRRFQSTHHPFTMIKLEDYDLLSVDPLKVRGEHYDFVMNGVEVGGGSRRIHDPQLQQFIFENILDIKNFNELFGHLLKALSMGCPPHAGLALGFDRLCTMLIGGSSIRDVLAFPKNQSGIDPVIDSPSEVSHKVLNEYYIKNVNN